MDKLRLPLNCLAVYLLCFACQPKSVYKAELGEIDSLRMVLAEYSQLLDSLDTEENLKLASHVDTQYNYLMANYPDPNDREFWLKEVSNFGTINKALGRLQSHSQRMREDIAYADKQLHTLGNSIEDNKLSAEQIDEYLQLEASAIAELELSFKKYIAPSKLALKLWIAYEEPYDSIVNHLRNSQ